MTRDDLINLHNDTCADACSIMKAKNHDYTSGSNDPFANFKLSEVLGIPAELGLLIRCLDKIKRINSFILKGELAVKDEPVDDAIRDIINYMVLLKGMIIDRKSSNILHYEE